MSLVLVAAASVFAALQTPAPVTPEPLTLDEAVAIAQRNAFAIRITQSNVEISRQRLSQARGQLGPALTATGNYQRTLTSTTISLGPDQTFTSDPNSATVGAAIRIPIDITGSLHRLARAAGASVQASQATAQATRNDVAQNAKVSFFNVLRTQGLVNVAQAAVTNARERAAQGELLFRGDQIARVDLDRLQVQVAQAESDLTAAQNNLQLTINAFNQALARPIETPVALAEVTTLPPAPTDATPLVTAAQTTRPEVRSLRYTQQTLAAIRQATESGLLPSLGAQIGYQRTVLGQSLFSSGDDNATLGVSLSWPIYDSGVTRAKVKEARQNEEQARINLEQVQLGISQEVRNALTNLTTARSRYETAQRQVTLAEEVYRLATVRQQAGEGTYVEIVDAQTQLTQARNQVVSARYDYLTAYANLQHALGTDQVPVEGGTGGTN